MDGKMINLKKIAKRSKFNPKIRFLILIFLSSNYAWGAGLENSVIDVELKVAAISGCHWDHGDNQSSCYIDKIKGNVFLSENSQKIESIEINTALVDTNSNQINKDQIILKSIIKYLLPQWTGTDKWMDRALSDAKTLGFKKYICLNGTWVLVMNMHPTDIPITYALVVVTNKNSLEPWMALEKKGSE